MSSRRLALGRPAVLRPSASASVPEERDVLKVCQHIPDCAVGKWTCSDRFVLLHVCHPVDD